MENEQTAIMLTQHEQKIHNLENRMQTVEEIQKQINSLTVSIRELALSVRGMTEEQKDQSMRLRALESKPAGMWDSVVKTTVSIIVGAVIGAFVALVFK